VPSDFSILADWISDDSGSDELRHTSALIQVIVNGRVVTRVEDEWSKSVRTDVRLSAYPLALWFASSWWRLGWEPAPNSSRSISWRMAHEMAAAGHGLLWPRMVFESDGESVEIAWHSTEASPTEPMRYLDEHRTSAPLPVFEAGVHTFVNLVLARLNAVGVADTELRALWKEVCEERHETEATRYRRLEARLGFDPDDTSSDASNRLLNLANKAGIDAINEIAPVCAGPDPGAMLDTIIAYVHAPGIEGRIHLPEELRRVHQRLAFPKDTAWARGWQLARLARAAWRLTDGPIDDRTLAELLSVSPGVFGQQADSNAGPPLGLAVRNGAADRLKLLFRKRNRPGRRFELARFVADNLAATPEDHWLPVTDTGTARQKIQRAFAIEFLAPIAELVDRLNGDFSDEALDEAGDYYGVSALAVQSHLANNRFLPRF